MAKEMFVFEGVEYPSRVKAAIALLDSKRAKNQSEAAKLVGINPATVNANYGETGAKAAARRAKYQAVKLLKTAKYTPGDIAEKTGLSTSLICSIAKKGQIQLVKVSASVLKAKEAKAKAAEKAKAKAATKPESVKKTRKVKVTKVETTVVPVEPVIDTDPLEIVDDIPMDEAAEAAAKADMASA
jgi:hypothetical protein